MRRIGDGPPAWLREANRRLREQGLGAAGRRTHGPPRVGELRVAEPVDPETAETRIVCIVDVDPVLATARAALTSNEVDGATAADLLAPSAGTGLPFELVVETDVTGTLWWSQLARRVGRLDRQLAGWLRAAARSGSDAVPAHLRGMPVASADDPRRLLKVEESRCMRDLAAECEDAIAGGGFNLPLLVDPALVVARPSDDPSRYAARLNAVAAAVADSSRAVLPAGAAPLLLKAWDRGLRTSLDAWNGLQPLLERALSGAVPVAQRTVHFEPLRRSGSRAADRALADACSEEASRGRRAVRLLTGQRAWSSRGTPGGGPAAARLAGGGRLWLIRHHLEVSP